METKKIVMGVISVAVAIVVLMSMIPIFTDAGASEDTYTNEGFFYANYLTSTSTDTLTWDYADPTILTINDIDVDTSQWDSSYQNVTVAFSNKWFIRFALDTTVIYLYDVDTAISSSTDYCSPSNEKNFSMVCASGTATITMGEEVYTETIAGDGLIITGENTGAYVMKKSSTNAYVLGDSLVYGSGRTDRALGTQGTSTNIMYKASVDDGAVLIGISPNTYEVTTTSVTYSEVSNGHEDLYQLSKFTVGLTDGENTGTLTYNQIFVPSEVHAERSVHASPVEATLIGLIPLLMMVGIMLTAVGLFIAKYRKN